MYIVLICFKWSVFKGSVLLLVDRLEFVGVLCLIFYFVYKKK